MNAWRGFGARNLVAATPVLLIAATVTAPHVHGQDAASLRARFAALQEQFADSPFQRPLLLESIQTDDELRGEVHAVLAHGFDVVLPALKSADHWCDILMLHLNVKGCRTMARDGGMILSVFSGRKFDQPLDQAYRFDFDYRVVASAPDYLQLRLAADRGPLGTRDYGIRIEASPVGSAQTLLHMTYAYGYGLAAKLATQVYLSTVGRDKVGFSIVGHQPDGTPAYIAGERGVIERNTMRYYLAVEAYLAAQAFPREERDERRLRGWFDAIELYPRQLHELERDEYLRMKRSELARQRAAAPSGSTRRSTP